MRPRTEVSAWVSASGRDGGDDGGPRWLGQALMAKMVRSGLRSR